MYNARILWPVYFSPQSAILDILERLLATPFHCWKFAPFCERHSFLCIVAVCWWKNEAYTDWYYSILLLSVIIKCHVCNWCKSSATTPFYCLKFAPFWERHSFLCIVAVCWWKNEAYTDWYYSILVLSVIINSVTFVTDDFIFAKMESIKKLLDKNVAKFADISKPFLTFPLSKCRILWNLLFLQFLPYLLLSLFT